MYEEQTYRSINFNKGLFDTCLVNYYYFKGSTSFKRSIQCYNTLSYGPISLYQLFWYPIRRISNNKVNLIMPRWKQKCHRFIYYFFRLKLFVRCPQVLSLSVPSSFILYCNDIYTFNIFQMLSLLYLSSSNFYVVS